MGQDRDIDELLSVSDDVLRSMNVIEKVRVLFTFMALYDVYVYFVASQDCYCSSFQPSTTSGMVYGSKTISNGRRSFSK